MYYVRTTRPGDICSALALDRPEATKPRRTTTCGVTALVGTQIATRCIWQFSSKFRREEKCSGEVRLGGSDVLVVFVDSPEQPSG